MVAVELTEFGARDGSHEHVGSRSQRVVVARQ